jgi:hypothetical protein
MWERRNIMALPFEINSHQAHAVEALVDSVIMEAGTDPGIREECLLEQLETSTRLFGDFTPEQAEVIFYNQRQQVLRMGNISIGREPFLTT